MFNVSCTVFSDSSPEDGSSSDNEDNECDDSRYLSTQSAARSKKRKWIQCDSCDKWLHVVYINLTYLSAKQFGELEFIYDTVRMINENFTCSLIFLQTHL